MISSEPKQVLVLTSGAREGGTLTHLILLLIHLTYLLITVLQQEPTQSIPVLYNSHRNTRVRGLPTGHLPSTRLTVVLLSSGQLSRATVQPFHVTFKPSASLNTCIVHAGQTFCPYNTLLMFSLAAQSLHVTDSHGAPSQPESCLGSHLPTLIYSK